MSDFRIRGSEDLAHGGFLTLSRVAVEGPESESITRHVVHHPGAVVVVPVDDDRRHVLLVRQWRVAADRELLEVVAGKRDVEHEPPEETARRELAEEIGKVAGHLVPLCEFYNSPGFCDEYSHLYCALDLDDTAERHPVRTEEAAMTVEDPETYNQPWQAVLRYRSAAGAPVEAICAENNLQFDYHMPVASAPDF